MRHILSFLGLHSFGNGVLLCFVSIISTSLGYLVLSHGILTQVCGLANVGFRRRLSVVLGLSVMVSPGGVGINWVCAVG